MYYAIINEIKPAVDNAKKNLGKNEDLLTKAIIENVKEVARQILTDSPVIAHEVHEGKARVLGAFYSIASGKVAAVEVKGGHHEGEHKDEHHKEEKKDMHKGH